MFNDEKDRVEAIVHISENGENCRDDQKGYRFIMGIDFHSEDLPVAQKIGDVVQHLKDAGRVGGAAQNFAGWASIAVYFTYTDELRPILNALKEENVKMFGAGPYDNSGKKYLTNTYLIDEVRKSLLEGGYINR